MSLISLGLNHSSTPVAIREQVGFLNGSLAGALCDLQRQPGVSEALILSTCNRTEIYCVLDTHHSYAVHQWFHGYHQFTEQELYPYLYSYPDTQAVRHLLRVASGLDSMILGETQILGQLKQAYHTAVRTGSIGRLLNRLFQHSFRVAKQIRNSTTIGSHPVSVAFSAVKLAQQIFGDLHKNTALLIGSGKTAELLAHHLQENGLQKMIIANRTIEPAQQLASRLSAYPIPLTDVSKHLAEADIVFSSTASPTPILDKATVASAIKARKHRPMLMIDIAVPRDIEPETKQLADVYLYTIDDLKDLIQENIKSRQQAAIQAEKIIDDQVDYFTDWIQSLDAVATIRSLRTQIEAMRQQTIESAVHKLAQGADPRYVLYQSTHTLVRKIMHTPSIQLRHASTAGRTDLLKAIQELFALDADDIRPD